MSDLYPHINPREIIILRSDRQRQENIADIEDMKQSVALMREKHPETGGYINPVVVRMTAEGPTLVAGERRLTAALALDLPDIPYRDFGTLSQEEAEVIELEENIKRKELTWRDQVRAVGRLHSLYRQKTKNWSVEQTALGLGYQKSQVHKILHVYGALDGGRIGKAEGIEQAYNMLHRFSERQAESIVNDIITRGATVFGANAMTAESAITYAAGNANATQTSSEEFTTVHSIAVSAEDLIDEAPSEATAIAGVTAKVVTNVHAGIELKGLGTKALLTTDPVICANFADWAASYTGPKFTLIHCDFPYGNYRGGDSKGAQSALETEEFYDNTESVYWHLVDTLTANLDRIMSYSAHLMFWFNMNFYTETVARLRKAGLMVHDHPLIWHKTGGPGGLGVVPGTAVTYPRRTYDTALLAVRGNRPLAKPGMNSYAAPTAGNKIHPSQKPEPMLRFFLQMLVDETTSVLDPTCGSAAALRAAEDLGAKSVLGLELDPNYAESANTQTLKARVLRQAGQLRRKE